MRGSVLALLLLLTGCAQELPIELAVPDTDLPGGQFCLSVDPDRISMEAGPSLQDREAAVIVLTVPEDCEGPQGEVEEAVTDDPQEAFTLVDFEAFTIGPGVERELWVEFDATEPGAYEAQLVLIGLDAFGRRADRAIELFGRVTEE